MSIHIKFFLNKAFLLVLSSLSIKLLNTWGSSRPLAILPTENSLCGRFVLVSWNKVPDSPPLVWLISTLPPLSCNFSRTLLKMTFTIISIGSTKNKNQLKTNSSLCDMIKNKPLQIFFSTTSPAVISKEKRTNWLNMAITAIKRKVNCKLSLDFYAITTVSLFLSKFLKAILRIQKLYCRKSKKCVNALGVKRLRS